MLNILFLVISSFFVANLRLFLFIFHSLHYNMYICTFALAACNENPTENGFQFLSCLTRDWIFRLVLTHRKKSVQQCCKFVVLQTHYTIGLRLGLYQICPIAKVIELLLFIEDGRRMSHFSAALKNHHNNETIKTVEFKRGIFFCSLWFVFLHESFIRSLHWKLDSLLTQWNSIRSTSDASVKGM